MTDREKIIEIIDKWASRAVITKINGASVYDQNNAAGLADALIEAGIGDVTALKERAGSEIKSCYKEIAEKRDETAKLRKQLKRAQNAAKKQKRRAEVVERALVIMAKRVLEYAEKAKVMATTSDGLFSCEKDAQLALLANDALLKAEQKLAEEKKEGNNGRKNNDRQRTDD